MKKKYSRERKKYFLEKVCSDLCFYGKELLFPRRCPVCDRPVKGMERLCCKNCEGRLETVKEPWCLKCGKPLVVLGDKEAGAYCHDCSRGEHCFSRGRAVFTYDSAALSLYRFKYGGRQEYADYYGMIAACMMQEEEDWKKADALIPVPLHPSRQKKRGYNQAKIFADVLSKDLGVPVMEDLVVRCKRTVPMKLLNPADRQNNLKKAFKIARNDVKLKTIILVDDIYTTGSTIDAVSRVFLENGVHKIYFVTLAVGRGF